MPHSLPNPAFLNNFATNEDLATKFEVDLPHCVRNVTTTKVLLFKFLCNIFIGVIIIKEMPGSVASGTRRIWFLYIVYMYLNWAKWTFLFVVWLPSDEITLRNVLLFFIFLYSPHSSLYLVIAMGCHTSMDGCKI